MRSQMHISYIVLIARVCTVASVKREAAIVRAIPYTIVDLARGGDMCGPVLLTSGEDHSYVRSPQTVNLRLAHALQCMHAVVLALP